MSQLPGDGAFVLPAGDQKGHDDILAREVFGVADFTDLSTDTQDTLRQLADDAAYDITNIAKWYHLMDSAYMGPATEDLADEFNELWRLMWTERAYRTFRSPQRAAEYHRDTVETMYRRVIDHFDSEFFAPTSDNWGDAISMSSLMRSVLTVLINQRTPVVPTVNEVTRTVRDEFVKMWEERRWNFRVRHTQIQISGTDGSVYFGPLGDPSDFGFDGFASKFIWIIENGRANKCQWLDSTRFAQCKAEYDQRETTGRPLFFFTEDWGSDPLIHWAPDPAADYTAYGNIILRAPAFSGTLTDSGTGNGLNSLPPPFRSHLRDRVASKLLSKWGREDTDARRQLVQVRSDAIELADNWAESGAETSGTVPPAGYKMVRQLRSYRGAPVIGQWE